MQPRTLTMKNFGPFIHESVDFGDFQEAGLFLISGKTGAGKTTIFDGMTFALFGETSGQLRSGKEMRSMFATPEEETAVTFHFEHQGFFYEIERSPEQEVKKKRGEGTKKQTAKVRLTIYNGQMEEQKQYTKRTEVDQFIKDLLNVDAKQFFQIILLPQGEFRNFLIAPSSEKEKLLRNLFGTELYQRLNEWFRQKQKDMDQSLSNKQQQMDALLPRFQWVAEKPFVSVQETLLAWQTDLEKLKEQHFQLTTMFDEAKEQKKQTETALYKGKEQLNLCTEQAELTEKYTTLCAQESEMQTIQQTVKRLSWVEKNLHVLTHLDDCRKEHRAIDEVLQELTASLHENKVALADWEAEKPAMNQLQEQIAEQEKKSQQMEHLVPIAQKVQELQKTEADYQVTLNQLQAKVTDYQAQQAIFEAARDTTIASQKENLQVKELQYVQLTAQVERWQEGQAQLATIQQQIQANEAELAMSHQTLAELVTTIDTLGKECQQRQSDYAKLQIARLQLLLVDGEPCPVCGATEHSHDVLPVSEEDIVLRERLFEEVTQQLRAKEDEQQQVRYQQQTLQATQNDLLKQQTQLVSQGTTLRQEMENLLDEPIAQPTDYLQAFTTTLAQQKDQLTQKINEQEKLEADLQQVLTAYQTVQQEYQEIERLVQPITLEIKTLQKQLENRTYEDLLNEQTDLQQQVSQHQKRLTEFHHLGEELNRTFISLNERQQQQTQQLQAVIAKEQEQATNLQQALQMSDFASEEEMRSASEEIDSLPSLQEQVTAYNQERAVIERRLQDLAQLIVEPVPNITQLQAQYNLAEEQVTDLQTQVIQQAEVIQSNRQLLEELENLAQQSSAQLTEMMQLQQLSQTLNGDNPEKMSIERYVLQSFLAEILAVANQRLNKLTRGRYQFLLADKKGSYRSSTGLEINIYDDNAGMSRRAHTLSGGESFIAALALALSLADVIQNRAGGIAIEALFIDEGFGSLDEESLEMAMEALEIIENEGRMIGIISHVRELKDRIQQQLIVQTNGSGQSHIKSQVV